MVTLITWYTFGLTCVIGLVRGSEHGFVSFVQRQKQKLSVSETSSGSSGRNLEEATDFVLSLAAKASSNNATMTPEEGMALHMIKHFIEEMINDTDIQHTEDQKEVTQARDLIQTCSDETHKLLEGEIRALKLSMELARTSHSTCRASQAQDNETKSKACADYDVYRKFGEDRIPPVCFSTRMTLEYISTSDATKKTQMEACLTEMNSWVVPLHDTFTSCATTTSDLETTATLCNSKQTAFESSYCSYAQDLRGACDEQARCRNSTIGARNKTHDSVQESEASRKIHYESGNRLLCYLQIFDNETKNATEKLDECKAMTVDTSRYKIEYHAIPQAHTCVQEQSVPCDAQWMEIEYEDKAWHGNAKPITCQPCQTTTTWTQPAPESNFAYGGLFVAGVDPPRLLYVPPDSTEGVVAGSTEVEGGFPPLKTPSDFASTSDGGFLVSDLDRHYVVYYPPWSNSTTKGRVVAGGVSTRRAELDSMARPFYINTLPDGSFIVEDNNGAPFRFRLLKYPSYQTCTAGCPAVLVHEFSGHMRDFAVLQDGRMVLVDKNQNRLYELPAEQVQNPGPDTDTADDSNIIAKLPVGAMSMALYPKGYMVQACYGVYFASHEAIDSGAAKNTTHAWIQAPGIETIKGGPDLGYGPPVTMGCPNICTNYGFDASAQIHMAQCQSRKLVRCDDGGLLSPGGAGYGLQYFPPDSKDVESLGLEPLGGGYVTIVRSVGFPSSAAISKCGPWTGVPYGAMFP